MGIKRFFDKDIVVRRLKVVSGNRRAFQSTATVSGHIQVLDRMARNEYGISLEKRAWIGWFPEDADIQEGDRIYDEDNTPYEVVEVTIKDYGINRHKVVIFLEQSD